MQGPIEYAKIVRSLEEKREREICTSAYTDFVIYVKRVTVEMNKEGEEKTFEKCQPSRGGKKYIVSGVKELVCPIPLVGVCSTFGPYKIE